MSKEALVTLKAKATELGITFSPNIGEVKLQEKVNAAIIAKSTKVIREVKGETKEEKRARKRKESTALIRVRVTCFDPTMKKRAGTYIMASNSLVGTVKKFVQFNKPWLMPQILVNVMEESKYQAWIPGKEQFGITKMVSSLEPRYNVARLAQLTPQEVANIEKRQVSQQTLEDSV